MSSQPVPISRDPIADDPSLDLPTANWTPPFREAWRADAGASVVVFLVALPLCLGVALASGAPLLSGIITGVIGGLVVGALSGSHLMVSGPAAGLTAIVLSAITTLGSFRAFLVAVFLSGLVQIALGFLRAGVIGYYFPNAVIRGMLGGIGIIIILKQLPHAFGYDATPEGTMAFQQNNDENTFSSLVSTLDHIHPGAVTLSLISLALLILWDQKFMKRVAMIPGALVAVILGVILNGVFTGSGSALAIGAEHLVALPVITSLGELRASVESPDWSVITSSAVWTVAVTVAVIASIETLLSLEATDRIDPLKREAPANRELLAQGVGNALCGLFGGLPMTGVIVRSSANVYAGAKTKASAILHGVLLLLAVVTIPMILNRIPLAVLASILIYTGWKLAHPRQLRYFLTKGSHQWLPFVVTTSAILLTDLLKGIVVGLSVSLVFILLEHLRSPSYTISAKDGSVTRITLHEHLTFLSKANLTSLLQTFGRGAQVIIDGSRVKRADHDVMEVLREFRDSSAARGVGVQVVGLELGGGGLAH
ncbi:MAG TPA: SulP family inorganic anion transporter [Gemmatimonadaceae bacterium]|jgi:MFS superfamily sulfate permease-like transporter|nr:SulP family inorganic anion transporter [Gemmatimonadota bacterium]MBK9979008.1 SulP family inorganic anion transporter [Gemmatimonadota bacterium]HPV74454.1 SulP family inorganic anion transporter [Gemmatimonadaceae bacterium]